MNAPFPIPQSAAFMPLHRASRRGLREPQTVRTVKRRERRAPIRQLVTNCNQLKIGCIFVSQPVTDCHRLKIRRTPDKLLSPP